MSLDKQKRITISFFDGINTLVGSNISKKTELTHAENVRSKVIGTIEGREGTSLIGRALTATANYGLFYFDSSASSNNLYRISKVGTDVNIYYLNASDVWTKLAGNGSGDVIAISESQFSTVNAESNMFLVNGSDYNKYIDDSGTMVYQSNDIGNSTTQFDITNPSGSSFKYTYDGTGTDPKISYHVAVNNYINIIGSNFSAGNRGSFLVTAVDATSFTVTNASGVVESNKTIGANGAIRTNNHLTDSPKAYKINYYKGRLYLADYTSGVRRKNEIMMSSPTLGIASLIDGDHTQPITSLKVTDLKYIKSKDVLDVYRGDSKIGTIIVTGKDTDTNTLTIDSFTTDLKSSDELWVANTYSGDRVFRWAANPETGEDVKEYDTFKLSGGQNDSINMLANINNLMVISNNNNIGFWNGNTLQLSDTDIGCVSKNGYVKAFGTLWFMHYTGIYGTNGGVPNLMSAKVQRYIDGATKAGLEASCAGKKGYSVFFYIGAVTLYRPDGSIKKTLSDVVLEYNIRQENWFVHTNIKATQFETYINSTNSDSLVFTSTETKYPVLEFLTGQTDNNGTTDEAIHSLVEMDNITFSEQFENIVYLNNFLVELERGSGLIAYVSLDGANKYELEGDVNKGCTRLNVNKKNDDTAQPVRCRQATFSLANSTRKIFKLTRVAIDFAESNEKEEHRADYE